MGLIAFTNYARFGSPLKTGYHLAYPTASALLSNPFLQGIRDLLFSPEIGLLLFAPWVLVAFACFAFSTRRHPAESALGAGILLINLLFFAKYDSWHGGWVAGPRFLLPALPFFVLPLAPGIEKLRYHGVQSSQAFHPAFRPALIGLVVCGFLTQVVELPYPDQRYYILEKFYHYRSDKPWWMGSILLASLDFVFNRPASNAALKPLEVIPTNQQTALLAEQQAFASLRAGANADDALRLLPDSEHLLLPNLLLLKLKWLGVPKAFLYGYLALAMAIGLIGLMGLTSYSGP